MSDDSWHVTYTKEFHLGGSNSQETQQPPPPYVVLMTDCCNTLLLATEWTAGRSETLVQPTYYIHDLRTYYEEDS
jgi:hypothetical protein